MTYHHRYAGLITELKKRKKVKAFFPQIIPYQLIKVFPVVLRHQSKGGEEGPAEGVETRVPVVGVRSVAL